MRWLENSTALEDDIGSPPHVRQIVWEAYHEGFIKYTTYRKALKRIETVQNGSWMFEHRHKENESWQI